MNNRYCYNRIIYERTIDGKNIAYRGTITRKTSSNCVRVYKWNGAKWNLWNSKSRRDCYDWAKFFIQDRLKDFGAFEFPPEGVPPLNVE